jgi:predicted phage baseplate assembly protein
MPQDQWTTWGLAGDERNDVLFLDQAHEEILPSSYVVVQKPPFSQREREVLQVTNAELVQRNAYGTSGKTTRLTLAAPWWNVDSDGSIALRQTLVFAQSEELILVDGPITSDVQLTEADAGTGIVLDGLYSEFPSGRWVVLSGERADIPNVSGVRGTELLMVSGLRQVEPTVTGERIHTALLLATPTAYSYKRETLTIYGNVVKATHGETTNETLGSGDGSQAMQSFELKQPPITFVPAPNPAGVESTLEVFVNNVEWHEADALFDLGPRDRKFITKTDDADKTTVIFGNGRQGSRLPTGVLNVTSIYRRGIGKPGNVKPEQVSLLQSRPLGVKSVINPLRASGGADREDADQIRENAPLAVMALDRLVSLQDYSDFTRTFAGIAKVSGRRLTDGSRQFVHLTIAGADDIPIDPVSDLYRNLSEALELLGDVSVAVRIDARELIVLVLSANIRLEPDYLWDPVAAAVRAALFEKFGFRKRALGQPALLCEIIGCIQSIEGVAYVDVDAFGGVSENVSDFDGTRRLQTLEEISETIQQIVTGSTADIGPTPSQSVPAGIAGFKNGGLIAAQLAIFSSNVPDTVVLNQIK